MMYKLLNKGREESLECILRINDNDTLTVIVCNEEVPEYQEYLKWVEAGNTPLPADNPPEETP